MVDEAAAESFPASDAPAWSAMQLGAPSQPSTWGDGGRDVRASLRDDLERLAVASADRASRDRALEEVVVRGILDAGRAVLREPIADGTSTHDVEAEVVGTLPQAACIVVGARYDVECTSAVAMQLALVRALSRERLHRTVRFVAFGDGGGAARYVERLGRDGTSVEGIIRLARVDLARHHRHASLYFIGDLRSAHLAWSARSAFRRSSRVAAHALVVPRWLRRVAANDDRASSRAAWPAVVVTDRAPWRPSVSDASNPDIDRMVAAVPGFVAAIVRWAGRV